MSREQDSREQHPDPTRDRSRQLHRHDCAFTKQLNLPDGRDRESIDGYRLRGSEVRTLATIGAFRVVPRSDLEQQSATAARELDRLRQAGLVSTTPYRIGRERMTVVTLTHEGLELLERNRLEGRPEEQQAFYAGVGRPRELTHDIRLYGAYVQAEERLLSAGSKVRRVVLEQELKRDYQRFLQRPNRDLHHRDGRPRRDSKEVSEWASAHDLPVIRDSVRFPDLRIEYETSEGTLAREDLEIVTENYRGAHAASTAASGFRCQHYRSTRVGGRPGSGKSGRSRDDRLAEEICG